MSIDSKKEEVKEQFHGKANSYRVSMEGWWGKGFLSLSPGLWTPVPLGLPQCVPSWGSARRRSRAGARADFLYSLRLTLGDLLFDFIGPLAFMRVICKAWGFNVQHQKANSCVRKCHRD